MKNILFIFILCLSLNACSQTTSTKEPLIRSANRHGKTALSHLLTQAKWNELFPNRHGLSGKIQKKTTFDFYSFKAFVAAEGRDVNPVVPGRFVDRLAGFGPAFAAVDAETDGRFIHGEPPRRTP